MGTGAIYKVTLHLDGRGVILTPHEPIHLDGLIFWGGAFRYPPGEVPGRDEPIEELPIPVRKRRVHGHDIYCASALFPIEELESGELLSDTRHWRKRFRSERAEALCANANINQSTGEFRSYNTPVSPLLSRALVGWFQGDRRTAKKWFRPLRALGRKREMGFGRITSIDFEETDEDRTTVWEGRAMRFLPHPLGLKRVRPRPPYWSSYQTVRCLMPGQPVPDAAELAR